MVDKIYKGILITGGAGFLGSHLAEYFIKNNISVTVVDNLCSSTGENIEYLKRIKTNSHSHFEYINTDVCNIWDWTKRISHEVSHIFHLASPASPPIYKELSIETLQVNSIGLLNALNFGRSVGARLVFSSTSEIYGDPLISPQPETYWGNVNSYGERSCYDEAKRFGEALIYSFNKKYNTENGLVRIFNTYGPRMNIADGRVIINLLSQTINNQPLTIYGSGLQTRSFCYVTDLISGLVKYGASDLKQPVNLGNDTEFTILELISTIQKLFPDKKLIISHLEESPDDPKQRRPDLKLAKELLYPWEPKVELKQGLSLMVDWIKSLN